MAATNRRKSTDLTAALEREPHRFQFFQAIRVLTLAAPGGLPAGLRFRTPASLAFPASEILRLGPGTGGRREMEVAFLGLTGPAGVLPQPYTETILERRHRHRDGTLHAFLDIFSHRAIALRFDAWRKYRFHIDYERGRGDGFSAHLADLLPMRPPDRDLPGNLLLHFAGLLGRQPLPACSMVAIITSFFQVAARLEPFHGRWTALPAAEQTRLGGPAPALGQGAFLGARIWDQQHSFRLRLGPLAAAPFRDFLPGRPGLRALARLVKLQTGGVLACDLELAPEPAAVPAPRLAGGAAEPPRLGLDSWLCTLPLTRPPAAVAFRLLT